MCLSKRDAANHSNMHCVPHGNLASFARRVAHLGDVKSAYSRDEKGSRLHDLKIASPACSLDATFYRC
eukprot:1812645-Pleurochrysis_carterae.AAC.5